MKLRHLLLRNLRFHRRGNLAVLLGAALGTAVLTGALVVGDSLRGSLRDLTLRRLGWIDEALLARRFFGGHRGLTANECAAILLQGSATSGSPQSLRRAANVQVIGVDHLFWQRAGQTLPPAQGANDAVLNRALARELGVQAGDVISLYVPRPESVPRESFLGRRDTSDVLAQIPVTVQAVLDEEAFGNDFTLAPQSAPPRNAFVGLGFLQQQLSETGINAIFAGGKGTPVPLILDDWGLRLYDPESFAEAVFHQLGRPGDKVLQRSAWRDRVPQSLAARADPKTGVLSRNAIRAYYARHRYFSLESKQMMIEEPIVAAALQAAAETGMTAAPTFVYLANSIKEGDQSIPYSVVAALDPTLPPPLGPFLPEGVADLKEDEIILAGWKESPLAGKAGDTIELTYFAPEHEGKSVERTAKFRLRGILPMEGVANDPELTPEFPGVTDKLNLRDWDPPFPYDNKRVGKRDEDYWNTYRATPKAYITLAAGQKLWGSRFGNVTAIRLAPPKGTGLKQAAENFTRSLQPKLRPEWAGFVFEPVKQRSLDAAGGSTDFGMLFLGFSSFLIVAALLLVALLFRLNIDRRAGEIGLLMALGYRRRTVRWLLLGEGAMLAALGGLVGLGAALLYAKGLLALLRTLWPGGLGSSYLTVHASAESLLIGYAGSLLVALLTVAWAVRVLGRAEPRSLLAGDTASPEATAPARLPRWSLVLIFIALVGGVAALVAGGFLHEAEARAGTFFTGGFLLLTAGLLAVWLGLRSLRARRPHTASQLRVGTLAVRNAARHPVRSLLTAGLLASATFLIIAVESFHREPEKDFLQRNGGSGGFAFVGETDVPVFQDLNTDAGRDMLTERDNRNADLLEGVNFMQFRLHRGDDASCLNLFAPRKPRLLGVPHQLVERGGFQFTELAEQRSNPWTLLEEPQPNGAIPVFGEANTMKWILKKDIGDLIEVNDADGNPVQLRVVGYLQDSVFQRDLLMSEANLRRLYPKDEGHSFFLIDAPVDRADQLKPALETALVSYGFVLTSSKQSLATFLAVEDTYLATFQALGGLGLVLGALGLAVVLLRTVWERRGEIALLRALGLRRSILGRLVLLENAALLATGLSIGTVSALASVAPHLLSGTGSIPWLRLAGMLLLVLLTGLASGAAAFAVTVRAPLLPALRRE